MLCTHCGHSNNENENFCTACGKALEQAKPTNPAPDSQNASNLEQAAHDTSPPDVELASPDSRVELYKAILGPKNQTYYLNKFARFDSKGRAGISWNWSAFLVTFYWLIYRRMLLSAIVYFLMPFLFFAITLSVALMVNKHSDMTLGIGALLYAVLSILLPAMFSNALYYKRCKKIVARTCSEHNSIDRQQGALSAKGGTASLKIVFAILFAFMLGIGLLTALAIKIGSNSNTNTDEVLHHVGKELFEIDMSEWKSVKSSAGAANILKIDIPGDCSKKSEPHNCEPDAPMVATLSIATDGVHEISNDSGVLERYAALVQLGHTVLPKYSENADHNFFSCALLVRSKRAAFWTQEYLGEIDKKRADETGVYDFGCENYKLAWDDAGYPVLTGSTTKAVLGEDRYSTNNITIHLVNGTYKYDVEVAAKDSSDAPEKSRVSGSLCRYGEQEFFSCSLKNKKTAIVCGGGEGDEFYMQYRFGKPGATELEFPASRTDSVSQFRLSRYFRPDQGHNDGLTTQNLMFTNNGTTFDLGTGEEGLGDEESSYKTVITMTEKDKQSVTLDCVTGGMNIPLEVEEQIPCDPDAGANTAHCADPL